MHLCYFSNERQEDRFWELRGRRTVHLNNCLNRSKGFMCVCAAMRCESLWLDRGELTGLVVNPVILSSDQSNTRAFKLFNGNIRVKFT